MNVCSEKICKEQLLKGPNWVADQNNENHDYDRFVFTGCRGIEPDEVFILTNLRSLDWQVGFFDADDEVCFGKVKLEKGAGFSSIVRNYWWNGKEGEKKREGHYSLIKFVKELQIEKEHVNDFLDYVEGKYKIGEHWHLHKLDRNIKVKIQYATQTATNRLQKFFDNIWFQDITANLKIVNNITCNCDWYLFRNCEGVVPQKLIINATVKCIRFLDTDNEVHIPKVVMEKKADLKSIIQNKYGQYKHEKCYSLLPHVKALIIRNNPKMLCNLVNYINGRYNTYYGWKPSQLNKNMKIVIEKPGTAFSIVKEISGYFTNVLVDNNKPEEYLARQQPYQKQFQGHFDKYDLKTDQIGNFILAEDFILASQEFQLKLEDGKLNVGGSNRKINELHVNQKIALKQFICFHDTNKPVVIGKIVIKDGGNLRCVLQNAYYNGTDSDFFSLLQTTKELIILSHQNENYRNKNNQVLTDLADYIEGKYVLNENWKQEELDRDMRIALYNGRYGLSLSVVQRLKKYFKKISIDCIYTPLETENIIDQECEDKYIFVDSRKANPQKLIVNAKLMGCAILIAFKRADSIVRVTEITIDEQGFFAVIVRNHWQNNKVGNEYKYGFYSLVEHVKTLTIRNNSGAVKDFADYVVGKYEIKEIYWKLQQLSKDIKVVIEGPGDTFFPVLRISNYFNEVTVDGKQPEDYLVTWELWNDPDYNAFKTCFGVHRLLVEPWQYGIEFKKYLWLINCVYNIRKSMNSIDSLDVRQKLDINQCICFHDINKPLTVDTIVIDGAGDLRTVLQNAYYRNGQSGFFSLLKTAKRLEIRENEQAVEDLADYIDGKYALHPKWEKQKLDKNIVIKTQRGTTVSIDVVRKLRNYFRNVSIERIRTLLETENIIDQRCEYGYIFTSCRDVNPQNLVVNAKLADSNDLISFYSADGEVCIPEITIGEHGSFGAIARNYWWNGKIYSERKYGNYSLVQYVETLIIQNNPEAVYDLDRYVSGNYKIKNNDWKIQKLYKNIIIKINGVKGLDEQINRLRDYFGYIVIDGRKVLGNQRREAITNIKLDCDKIQQLSIANADKRNNIIQADAEIADTRRRIEMARAKLGRRRARFQEYLALAE